MKFFILLLSAISTAYSYNILCLHTVPSKSHYHLMMGLVKPLVEAGHEITLVTTYPELKVPKNVKIIDVSENIMITTQLMNMSMADRTKQSLSLVKSFGRNISLSTIRCPAVRQALVYDKFDAVISEWFFSEIDAGYAAVQRIPWILLGGMVMHTHLEFLVDCVRTVPTIPSLKNEDPIPMGFMGRLSNTIGYLFVMAGFWSDYPTIKSDYETQFAPLAQSRGVSLPPFSEAMHDISILFSNSHSSFAPAQSLPPNVVEIAGYHIDTRIPPLPKDLQDLLDSSPQGVIYFSMGSVLKSSELEDHTKKRLIQMFGELPYTVLWKFEEKIDGLPKNVHIRSWMPQSSILSHPNVKVFITHGGLLSTLESLQFGVPIITIPVFGDQPSNALRSVRAGYALRVSFATEMAEELKVKLEEMLNNDRYYKRAKYLSKLFTSRPVSPAKLIQHYVELAIESGGAHHLRSKTHLYAWHEAWMLDQLALLLITAYAIRRLFIKILSLCKRQKKEVKEKKKKH